MLDINATFLVTFAVVWILVLVLGKVFFHPYQKLRAEREGQNQGCQTEYPYRVCGVR